MDCIKTMDVDKVTKSGQLMGTNHTTTTWLRLEFTSDSDCITLPLYIYIKYLSPFQCNGLTYGCILTVYNPWMWAAESEWQNLDN